MVAADVIVPLEVAVVIAHVPIAAGRDVVDQCAVMQHRQVETAAIPRHQIGLVLVDAVVEALDDLRFRLVGRAQCPHAEAVAFAQGAGYGDHAMRV